MRNVEIPEYSHRDMQLVADRALLSGMEQADLPGRIGWLLAGAIGATLWWLLLTWIW
jgi:hypothetical protein